jgi:hypothetical protein
VSANRQKRAFLPIAPIVNAARDQFLAGSALTGDQHRSVQIGHTTDQIGKPSAESAAGRFAGSTTARGRGFRAE